MNSNTRRYASDLTDEEWAILEPLIPAAKPGGRPRRINMREVVNGIFYLLKTGCQWRMLPKDFPKWKTVHDYFAKWRKDGTWQRLNDALRERVRVRTAGAGGRGRDKTPSAGSIDSQSVKTEKGVSEAGMGANTSRDGNGTLLWTHLGLVLKALVTEADYQDRTVASWLIPLLPGKFPVSPSEEAVGRCRLHG